MNIELRKGRPEDAQRGGVICYEAFKSIAEQHHCRNAELFRWCLNRGLRVVQPMTLMSLDLYNEPAGAFLPSVIY